VIVPATGADLSGTNAVLDATASASYGVGITKVQFVLSGGSYNKTVIGTATGSQYGYILVWNSTSVPGGTYTLQSLATDAAGNTAYSTGITVTVDNTPPSTAVIVPATGATLRGPRAILDATASASYGVKIAKVQFVLTGGSYDESVIGTATHTFVGWVLVWNMTSVATGTYTLQSLATDAAGNAAYSPGKTIKLIN
jgi:zinc transporter ZupT